eukprot:g20374.t1
MIRAPFPTLNSRLVLCAPPSNLGCKSSISPAFAVGNANPLMKPQHRPRTQSSAKSSVSTARCFSSAGGYSGGGGAGMWGGRFSGKTDPRMEAFNKSIDFDKRMAQQDIRGSQAYARALCRIGIVTQEEADQLVKGLGKVGEEWAAGKFEIKQSDEDIHMANERR